MKKLLSKIAVLILLMLIVSIGGSNKTASVNKYTNKLSPLNQINETFLMEYILKRLPKDAKLVNFKATIVYFNDRKDVFKPTPIYPSLEPQWGITNYYITNVSEPYEAWSTQHITKVVGLSNPSSATIHMLQSAEIPNSFSANVGVSAKVVSFGVGFDVTRTYTTTLQSDLSILADSYGVIEAYPVYDVYNYDIMYKPFIGFLIRLGMVMQTKQLEFSTLNMYGNNNRR